MSDIVERLKQLAALKAGDPMPSWLPQFDWGPAMSALAREAADEIERLRSLAGEADVGPSFSELASRLRHHALDESDRPAIQQIQDAQGY